MRRHARQAHRRYRTDLGAHRRRRRGGRAAHRGAYRARRGAVLDERRKLERELTDAKKKLAMGGGAKADGEANGVRVIGDIKLMARVLSGIDIKDLKSLADEGKKQLGSGIVALVGVAQD